jgi:hypothetical protein
MNRPRDTGRIRSLTRLAVSVLAVVGWTVALLAAPLIGHGPHAQPEPPRRMVRVESRRITVSNQVLQQMRHLAAEFQEAPQKITSQGTVPVSSEAQNVSLAPGQVLRAKAPLESRLDGKALHILAPARYVMGVEDEPEPLTLAPVVIVEQGALVMTESGEFASDVLVGVEDVSGQGASRQLPQGIQVQLLSKGARVSPDTQRLAHTNAPFKKFRVFGSQPPDIVRLTLAMSFDPEEVVVDIPVERPSVKLTAPSTLAGWGVGATKVMVSLESFPSGQSRQVRLSATRGSLDKSIVEVSGTGAEEVWFRSAGTGTVAIHGESAGLNPASHEITLKPPIWFFVAAIIGAFLGAWVKNPASRGKGATSTTTRRTAALILGLVVAVAWALGVALTPIRIPFVYNELSVGLAGAFGAIASKAVLGKVSGEGGKE